MATIGIVALNFDSDCIDPFNELLSELRSKGHNTFQFASVAETADWMIANKQPLDILILDGCAGAIPGIEIAPSGIPDQYQTSHPIDLKGVSVERELENLRNPARIWRIDHKMPTPEQKKCLQGAEIDLDKCNILAVWAFSVNSLEAILRRIDELLSCSSKPLGID